MNMFLKLYQIGILSYLLLINASCSTMEDYTKYNDPEKIYSSGTKLLKNKDYLEAQEAFGEIRKRFPQSRFAPLAELRNADLEFDQDNYTEAAALYDVFGELYPTHAEADYALYRKALSYFKDTPSNIARDQSPALLALNAAQRLRIRYPDSQYRDESEKILMSARLKLAQKEAYVAKFYEKKDHYQAALGRWRNIASNYVDLRNSSDKKAKSLIQQANEKIVELKKKISKKES